MKRSLPIAAALLAGLVVGLVVGALALAGGGSKASDFIDNERVERSIEAAIRGQRNRVSFAVCPALQKIEAGAKFTCIVTTLNNRRTRFLVTQRDDKGNVTFRAQP